MRALFRGAGRQPAQRLDPRGRGRGQCAELRARAGVLGGALHQPADRRGGQCGDGAADQRPDRPHRARTAAASSCPTSCTTRRRSWRASYPEIGAFFAAKRRWDPDGRFTQQLVRPLRARPFDACRELKQPAAIAAFEHQRRAGAIEPAAKPGPPRASTTPRAPRRPAPAGGDDRAIAPRSGRRPPRPAGPAGRRSGMASMIAAQPPATSAQRRRSAALPALNNRRHARPRRRRPRSPRIVGEQVARP